MPTNMGSFRPPLRRGKKEAGRGPRPSRRREPEKAVNLLSSIRAVTFVPARAGGVSRPAAEKKVTLGPHLSEGRQLRPRARACTLPLPYALDRKPCRVDAPQGERPGLQPEIPPKAQRTVERRATPRVCGPLPAIALDVTGSGGRLGVHTVLDNLSAGGFYLRLAQPVQEGEQLLVVTQVSRAVIVLRGAVLRVEPQEDGTCGLAVAVQKHQIFSLTEALGKQRRVPTQPDS